jgi:lipopolysaccharide/colanic/teichoic acid biosynthesis glycosyltransferase
MSLPSSRTYASVTAVSGRPSEEETIAGLPRGVEVVLAAAILTAASPLLLLAAAAVAASSPGPVLFRQTRAGLRGRPFTLLKLRTMRAAPAPGERLLTASGDPRITAVGRWLRRLKLDELPQLWNVLRGDMALVGPRPEVPRYVDADEPLWLAVLAVRPGLTDPVTLALRDEERLLAEAAAAGEDVELFYRERLLPAKLRGYREYLDRRTGATDLAVLARTGLAVVSRAFGR